MSTIRALLSNYVLNVSLLAWFCAQALKTILYLIKTRQLRMERMVGAGGMPSAHSASVCAMTIAISKSVGFDSPLFAISFLLAAIVMYDAMGVRRAAGEHAKVINMMVRRGATGISYKPKNNRELKEFLGHTPFEVLGGALLGILIALVVPM